MAFRWRADDGRLFVLFGSSLLHQKKKKKKKKKKVVRVGPPLAKLSRSAHALRIKTGTYITHSHERVLKKRKLVQEQSSHELVSKKEQHFLYGSIQVRTNSKQPGSEVIKLFFMLDTSEYQIYYVHKC